VESHSAAVLGNRTNLPSAEEMPSAFTLAMKSMEKAARANMTVVAVSKQDNNRRKQSCPSKADASAIRRSPVSPYVHGETYLPDFTGNSPWCNISAVKTGRVSNISVFVSVSANSITFLFQKEIKTNTASSFVFVLIYFQRDATLHSLFISGKLLYMFRVVSSPIIRSTYNFIYSIWFLLTVKDKNKLLVICL